MEDDTARKLKINRKREKGRGGGGEEDGLLLEPPTKNKILFPIPATSSVPFYR